MCSVRTSAAAFALAAALVGGPQALRAQQTRADSLLLHLDTLLPLVTQARLERDAAQARADSVRASDPSQRLDTVRLGPLTVVTFPGQAELAREVMEEVLAEWGGVVTRSPSLERTTFYFNQSTRTRPAALQHTMVAEVSAPVLAPRAFLEANARTVFWSVLQQDLTDTRVGRWVAGPLRPGRAPGDAYRELVTTPSRAARACATGDTQACLVALGLRVPEAALEAWYTPEERWRLALRTAGRLGWADYERWYPQEAATARRCADEGPTGKVDACDEVLGGADAPSPLTDGRSYLAWLALEAGGAGAFDRLAADPEADPEAALAAASGLSTEELAARWHAWVLENRPVVYADLAPRRWTAFFWFLFAGLLALGSTRWRVG